MWPLYVSQLVEAAAIRAVGAAVPDPHAVIFRAIAWAGEALHAKDSFFAVSDAHYEINNIHDDDEQSWSEVTRALERGALCIVRRDWAGLDALDEAHRRQCFVPQDESMSVLGCYRALASFMRSRFEFPVIAVGGSNGKTTTKDMLAHVIGATTRVTATPGTNNGWVGVPVTICHPSNASSAALPKGPGACVIEIGIDEKGAMADHVRIARPDIAVLTALGPEHLAGLGTHEDAIREELLLFEPANTKRVWLADDPALASRLAGVRDGDVVVSAKSTLPSVVGPADRQLLIYAWDPSCKLTIEWKGQTRDVIVPMLGLHNGRNAALAIATALLAGRPFEPTVDALATFKGPEQRCVIRELVTAGTGGSVVLIDDSYNASPSSIEAAVDVLASYPRAEERERIIVLGDMLDLGAEATRWHEAIVQKLHAVTRNAHVRLFGEHMSKLAPLLLESPLSIGRSSPPADPRELIDDCLLRSDPAANVIVLIKGSRGMALERVVQHVDQTVAAHAKKTTKHRGIGIVGEDAENIARALRASLSISNSHDDVFVRAISLSDLANGEAQRRVYDVAILMKLKLENQAQLENEEQLALIAQLFVHVGSIAILPSKKEETNDDLVRRRTGDSESDSEDDSEEAIELLAGVVPPTARISRASSFAQLLGTVRQHLTRPVTASARSGVISR